MYLCVCIQVEEEICSNFRSLFLKQGVKDMEHDKVLHFMCLAGFVLLLGRCCRGWTPKHSPYKSRPQTTLFDVGSFLIGVEVSLRQLVPEKTKGLIGPLTNGTQNKIFILIYFEYFSHNTDAAIRVNLSACNTFTDLVVSLWRSVHSARNHSHFPFSTVAHNVRAQDLFFHYVVTKVPL